VSGWGFGGLLKRYPEQCPGGQQQRFAIGRALGRPDRCCCSPTRPPGNLDEATAMMASRSRRDLVARTASAC